MSIFDQLKRVFGKQPTPEKPQFIYTPEPDPEPIHVPELTTAALKTQLAEGKPIVLIDVRSSGEQFMSHLPNARLAPMPTLPKLVPELDPNATTVVYCAHGYSSLDAAGFLIQQGFRDVYSLKGGITTWQAEGNAVVEPYKQAKTER